MATSTCICSTTVNGDGNFNFANERFGSSTTSTGNEQIKLTFPADGDYLVGRAWLGRGGG